jgi:hypothetical protein
MKMTELTDFLSWITNEVAGVRIKVERAHLRIHDDSVRLFAILNESAPLISRPDLICTPDGIALNINMQKFLMSLDILARETELYINLVLGQVGSKIDELRSRITEVRYTYSEISLSTQFQDSIESLLSALDTLWQSLISASSKQMKILTMLRSGG